MMLHEGYEGIDAYLYELNDTLYPGLGARIIAAMGLHVPIDLRPEIEEAPCMAPSPSTSGKDSGVYEFAPIEQVLWDVAEVTQRLQQQRHT